MWEGTGRHPATLLIKNFAVRFTNKKWSLTKCVCTHTQSRLARNGRNLGKSSKWSKWMLHNTDAFCACSEDCHTSQILWNNHYYANQNPLAGGQGFAGGNEHAILHVSNGTLISESEHFKKKYRWQYSTYLVLTCAAVCKPKALVTMLFAA